MVLKEICRKVLEDIFLSVKQAKRWKILIVDEMSLQILSACFSTEEILRHNIALIDLLFKKRDLMVSYEAIYILSPTSKAVNVLISDFQQTQRMYDEAYVFFLHVIPKELFHKLQISQSTQRFRCVKEINIAFEPVETQVFCVHEPEALCEVYTSNVDKMYEYCNKASEKIATLFCTLEEYPLIRYSRRHISNNVLADCVKRKLDILAESFDLKRKQIGRSHLLILDRGFDCVSPLLHELTLQAIVYDILPVHNKTLKLNAVEDATSNKDFISLDDRDEFWAENCHKHIATIADELVEITKKFNYKMAPASRAELRRLSHDMGNIILLQEKRKYGMYQHMVSVCLDTFSSDIKHLCEMEQDLSMRTLFSGEALTDTLKDIVSALNDESILVLSKIRLLLLFIFYNNGISEESLEGILSSDEFDSTCKEIISNFQYFGCNILKSSSNPLRDIVPRKDRQNQIMYKVSRWTPVLKDILELFIDNELDEQDFPYLILPERPSTRHNSYSGSWQTEKISQGASHLIIFITGGITYSEMRCVYEVTKAYSGWTIMLGSDQLLTPENFLKEVGQMSRTL